MRQRVNGVQIRRIGNGHSHLAVTFENRNDAVFFCDVARDDGNDIVGNPQLAELNNLRAELGRLGLCHIRLANDFVG